MSRPNHENIVNMTDYEQLRQRLGETPDSKILGEICEVTSGSLKKLIGHMLDKTDDALFSRAEKAGNNRDQALYFDAMREIRIIRKSIESDFISTFTQQYNHGFYRHEPDNEEALSLDWEGDSENAVGLVSADDLEENLAISNIVARVRNECSQPLGSLDQRFGILLRDPDLEKLYNPIGPEALCEAFRVATRHIETGVEIRLVIFKLFDQHVANRFGEIYKQANQHLINAGILPRIKPTFTRTPQQSPQPTATASAGQVTNISPASGTGTIDPAASAIQPAIYTLTSLQNGSMSNLPDNAEYIPELAKFADDLNTGCVNVLHQIKETPFAQQLNDTGSMTIDMVAMLFDYILNDETMPDAMRALIGRLQIPVLKVALLDRSFFSRNSHPTRQLLNRLASAGICWSEHPDKRDALFQKVSGIITTILDRFEDDISLFDRLLQEFDDFLDHDRKNTELLTERSVKVMEGEERLDTARNSATEVINPRIRREVKVDFVREFIATQWKNLLYVTCARHGKDSDEWNRVVATMDDLIWSIKPKATREDRARLVKLQPRLLANLREGIESLSVPVTVRDDFLARLIQVHGRTAIKEEMDSVDEKEDLPILDEVVEDADETTDSEPVEDSFTEKVEKLEVGQWLNFTDEDNNASRAKLSWISPITGTYLFTDSKGQKSGSYTQQQIADLMRSSRAVILKATPMMDRAVNSVLRELEYRKD